MKHYEPGQTWKGARVTVMGLGLFGGGVGAARFAAQQGAHVTVTDLRPAEQLAESLDALRGLPIRYVLGRHEEPDFEGADIVIASPAVPLQSPFLDRA
ncbi:MAG TPA: UDP-N-acetylmuramoyl-L-alanine--D-glutamate ligase, partial [Candidatus Latescibacteria bacterium]|nr:UDP-N-acetylmuramoyl-L-alanine--D-glutamate ligase [Candidatus Latescibacterota bacterium]